MNTRRWSTLAILTAAGLALGGCGGPDTGGSGGVGAGGGMVAPSGASLFIEVRSLEGQAISGASILVANEGKVVAETTSDDLGYALLENLNPGWIAAQVHAPGFTGATVVVSLAANVHGSGTAVLNRIPKGVNLEAEAGGTVKSGGVEISIPPGSLVDASGKVVTGTAQITIVPIDPSSSDSIAAMPAPLEGVGDPGGKNTPLQSLFMAEISAWQGGQPLNLKAGAEALVTFPVPAANAGALKPGDEVPSWFLDLTTGLWEPGNMGTLALAPDGSAGLVFQVAVQHFTYWNADLPWNGRHCFDVSVVDANGAPVAGVPVFAKGIDYTGGPAPSYTDSHGHACVEVLRDGEAEIHLGTWAYPSTAPGSWQLVTQADTTAPIACPSPNCTPITLISDQQCAPGAFQTCAYSGPAGTLGVGRCRAGRQYCNAGGHWTGTCVGEVTPQADEVCTNYQDDDCDGEINDGCPMICLEGATQACYIGPSSTLGVGACHGGTSTCSHGGTIWGPCSNQVIPTWEKCWTDADDDCDGTPSKASNGTLQDGCECNPWDEEPCYPGPAGTESHLPCIAGKRICHPRNGGGSFWGACLSAVTPTTETCDGADNDCNGTIDDVPLAGTTCEPGLFGVCNEGVWACSGPMLVCQQTASASPDLCDGLDNDCDIDVDEDDPAVGAACTVPGGAGPCGMGTGACINGSFSCVPDLVASLEVCDGQDNDCNGAIDEGGVALCPVLACKVATACTPGMGNPAPCQYTNEPVAGPCSDGPNHLCNGLGACVECLTAADCPNQGQSCVNNACSP